MELEKKTKIGSFLSGKQYPFIAIGVAFLISGIIIKIMGFEPVLALEALLSGALGNANAWGETLIKMIPLIFTALSFSIAMKCGIVNLGATGQVYMGSLAGTLIATNFPEMPFVIHIALALIAGMAVGGIYGWIAILLKNKCGANELVTTIMMNYIAIQFVNYMVSDPIRDYTATTALPQSKMVTDTAKLVNIVPNTRLHAGLFIAIATLLVYYIIFWHTTKGYELKITGLSQSVSKYAGFPVKQNQMLSMVMAGAVAGLGGTIEILAIQSRITQDWAGDIGFDGVAVALLGGNHPIGIALSAFLFGMLSSGSNKMQMMAHVPNAVIYMVQGLVVLFVVGRNIFIVKGKRGKKSRKETPSNSENKKVDGGVEHGCNS